MYLFLCLLSESEAGPISIDAPQELASFQGSAVPGALGRQRRRLLGFNHRCTSSAYRLALESGAESPHLRVHKQTETVTVPILGFTDCLQTVEEPHVNSWNTADVPNLCRKGRGVMGHCFAGKDIRPSAHACIWGGGGGGNGNLKCERSVSPSMTIPSVSKLPAGK